MTAFLSHSSKDKHFVEQVARHLGKLQIEYDEFTFEYTLNTRAIRRALSRSDIFVLFLSNNSADSFFVDEEIRTAHELRGKGVIKNVMIFAIDGTSYRRLPDWLRDINVAQQISSPLACARRIQSALYAVQAQDGDAGDIYIGRENEKKELRKALAVPADQTPLVIHCVGHEGIGRRTFLRKSLPELYPKIFQDIIDITVG